MYTILGAGLAGISAAYHLGHDNCILFEKNNYAAGHLHSYKLNGFTWDEGPHVSFTNHAYVKELLANNVQDAFLEYPVLPTNYYQGAWIPHPAQSNLFAIPEPLRTACLQSFLETRTELINDESTIEHYGTWLNKAFGPVFAEKFPAIYTQKYWTVKPNLLTTSWVGSRVFYPKIEDVKRGFYAPSENSTHYITQVRYPKYDGFNSYTKAMEQDMNVLLNKEVNTIDLKNKKICFKDNSEHGYDKLISTIPLPDLIKKANAPEDILNAAADLSCSQLLLINVEVNHLSLKSEQWLYVYDEEKYATRINFTELLSSENGPVGKCGIQVEVYFSKYRPLEETHEAIANKVIQELIEMELIKDASFVDTYHTKWVPFANVIFDLNTHNALNTVLTWLNQFGLARETDDLAPISDWDLKMRGKQNFGNIILAGRYGQWKYYWTDDCVLRGKHIANFIK